MNKKTLLIVLLGMLLIIISGFFYYKTSAIRGDTSNLPSEGSKTLPFPLDNSDYCDILLALKGCPSGNFCLRQKRGVPLSSMKS